MVLLFIYDKHADNAEFLHETNLRITQHVGLDQSAIAVIPSAMQITRNHRDSVHHLATSSIYSVQFNSIRSIGITLHLSLCVVEIRHLLELLAAFS